MELPESLPFLCNNILVSSVIILGFHEGEALETEDPKHYTKGKHVHFVPIIGLSALEDMNLGSDVCWSSTVSLELLSIS